MEKKGGGELEKGLIYATIHNLPVIMIFNVQKMPLLYTRFQKPP